MAEQRLGEELAIVGLLLPLSRAAGTYTSSVIDMQMFRRILATVQLGAMVATATLNAKLQASPDGSTDWQDIPSKAIAQLADTNSGKIARINLQAEECKISSDNQPRRYVRVSVTVAVANVTFGIAVDGARARYGPSSNYDSADVVEIVA